MCGGEPWITIDYPKLGKIYVDKVDEDQIEESGINPDFVEGDNWLHDRKQAIHRRYIPDHHIFLARGLFKLGILKVLKTLMHELSEVLAENEGFSYDKAHAEVANPVETEMAQEMRQ